MPDNGLIQKTDAHEMAHGRPVQITEHTTVTELQPSLSDVVCANKKLQIGFIVALVVLALLSGFVARPHFADTKTWDSTIEVIDQKKGNVLALTTSCVALSAGITALPGDTGTPVAEQLAQLSGNLGIVLAVLYLEKYLLTILWSVGLGILIPFALVLFAVSLGIHGRWSTSSVLRRVATRVLVVAIIGMVLVPASVWVSQKVDETYRVSIEAAEQKAADAAGTADGDSSKASKKKSESTESKNVLEQLGKIKKQNKQAFAEYVEKTTGTKLNLDSIFDVQVKRLHEYKRQQLNAMNIIADYNYLLQNPDADFVPKTYIFASKAAPGYYIAKQIIKMIWCIGEALRSIPGGLPRDPVRDTHARCGSFRADLPCRHRGFRYWQHEAHAQRCADPRHLRRR